jgi:hypothetical protein
LPFRACFSSDRIVVAETLRAREVERTGADQQHVWAAFQNAARHQYRVANPGDRCHCAEAEIVTGYHTGIHLDVPMQVQHRARTRVEQRIVLQHNHGRRCCIQRRATLPQYGLAPGRRGSHSRLRLLMAGYVPLSRTAMHRDGPSHCRSSESAGAMRSL